MNTRVLRLLARRDDKNNTAWFLSTVFEQGNTGFSAGGGSRVRISRTAAQELLGYGLVDQCEKGETLPKTWFSVVVSAG